MTGLRLLSVLDLSNPTHTSALVRSLEDVGYHRFWATEHRTPGQSASPTLVATVAGALTTRIRVGTAGIKLRYYNPMKVAEDFSLLELLFPGRVDLGILGQKESDPLIDSALLGEDDFATREDWYQHKFERIIGLLHEGYAADATCIRSARSTAPPPVWVCSLDPRSARMAGHHACKFAYSVYLPQQRDQQPTPDVIREYRGAYERTSGEEAVIVGFGACGESWADAQRLWRQAVQAHGDTEFTPNAGRSADGKPSPNFLGTPRQCHEQLCELASEYEVSEIVVQCVSGPDIEAKTDAYRMLASEFGLTTEIAERTAILR